MLNLGDFPLDYDKWRERTEDSERYWKRRGKLVVRHVVNLDDFLAWCSGQGVDPDGRFLDAYAERQISPELAQTTAGD
jgi:hypothetical protein